MTDGPAPLFADPPPAGWVGWCRPSVAERRVWRRVAAGATEAECWARLWDVIGRQGAGARDWCVLPAGERP